MPSHSLCVDLSSIRLEQSALGTIGVISAEIITVCVIDDVFPITTDCLGRIWTNSSPTEFPEPPH